MPDILPSSGGRGRLLWALLLVGGAVGCRREGAATSSPGPATVEAPAPVVRVVKPERKTVRRSIEQPGFNVEAFEETPLYARVTGYVGKWHADLGDRVKKGDVLAELSAPEMEEDLKRKEAAVRQAEAQIKQAQAGVLGAEAQLARAKSQYERIGKIGQGGVLDRESVEEARFGQEAAKAGVEKAKADVAAAEAQAEVARANRDYSKTMLRYTRITAPYDGVVTQRSVNTGDFVQPAGSGKAQPLYVIHQTDPVRVFVNVPGEDAACVRDGDPVALHVPGAGAGVIQGKVTRTARALNPQARTLRTEVDVPNPDGRLLPGMYVQARIEVAHADVWTLPAAAVVLAGDQPFCYRLEGDKAVRTPLLIGLTGSGLVEVVKKQVRSSPSEEPRWEDITGAEEVVAGEAASLTDGQPVRRSPGGG